MPQAPKKNNDPDDIMNVGANAGERLKSYIERIERLTEEKDALAEDIKEIYSEVKSIGLDVKIVRKQIARRKQDREQVLTEDALLNTYEKAAGDTTLEDMME